MVASFATVNRKKEDLDSSLPFHLFISFMSYHSNHTAVMDHSAAALPLFEYGERLKHREIRLLRLKEGKGASPVQFSIDTVHFDRVAEYQALSYVWGDENQTRYVSCNGYSFTITLNLFQALWQLRESGNSKPLWVDAICINQKDVAERTAQVRIMGDIYSSASVTLTWLGPPTDTDGVVTAFIEQLYIALNSETFGRGGPYVDLDVAGLGLPHFKSTPWVALFELLTRPWFSRVWVIQESVLALNTIFCYGSHMVPKVMFYQAAFTLTFKNVEMEVSLYQASRKTFRNSAAWVPGWNATLDGTEERSKLPFLEALVRSKGFAATNPKDKYFAIVGLASGVRPNFIDYQRSLREIVIDVAKDALTTGSIFQLNGSTGPTGLDLLSFVNGRRSLDELECLPSWAPEFSYNNEGFSGLGYPYPSAEVTDIGKCEFRFSVDDVSLP